MRIGVIDYGMGNLFSVEQALKRLDAEVVVTSDEKELGTADALVLPGVGAFPDAMKRLEETGLIDFIRNNNKPLLGICLGMQLMFEESEEVTPTTGLGIFKGSIKRFTDVSRIPHMGWNELELAHLPAWLEERVSQTTAMFISCILSMQRIWRMRSLLPQRIMKASAYLGLLLRAILQACNFIPKNPVSSVYFYYGNG